MKKLETFGSVAFRFSKVSRWIYNAAKNYSCDPYLLAGIVWKESCFDPEAKRYEPRFYKKYVEKLSILQLQRTCPYIVSNCQATQERLARAHSYGLMQIMLETARERGFQGVPEELLGDSGVQWGAEYFVHLIKLYNRDVNLALSAYNAGKPTDRNQDTYVEKVLDYAATLRNEEVVKQCFEGLLAVR